MGKIIVSESVSVDGVVEDPTGEEGLSVGGWFDQVGHKDREAWADTALNEALRAEALLLGRRSYEFFAARWPSRTGQFADRLNSLPKYVVSRTIQHADWNNSTVFNGDVATEVSKLKQQRAGDIVILASFQLVHTLFEHDLVDELRMMIYPFVLGEGGRLFAGTSDAKSLRLIHARSVGDSLAFLVYQPAVRSQTASAVASASSARRS